MELLLDTDFILKMGRLSLLSDFENFMTTRSHATPFRHLSFETNRKIREAQADPIRSSFGSQKTWNIVNSFVKDCIAMPPSTNTDVLYELEEVGSIDAGERVLIEYAIAIPEAIIVTCDKNFIAAMANPKAAKFRALLQKRIHHMEHFIFAFGQSRGWNTIRTNITKDSDCDAALHEMLHLRHKESEAIASIFASMRVIDRSSGGTVPAPL